MRIRNRRNIIGDVCEIYAGPDRPVIYGCILLLQDVRSEIKETKCV